MNQLFYLKYLDDSTISSLISRCCSIKWNLSDNPIIFHFPVSEGHNKVDNRIAKVAIIIGKIGML